MPYPVLDIIASNTSEGLFIIHYYADNGKLYPYPDEGLPSDCTWIPPMPNKWDY